MARLISGRGASDESHVVTAQGGLGRISMRLFTVLALATKRVPTPLSGARLIRPDAPSDL